MPELLSWDRCRELCGRVLDALDWAALGRIYFHEDGEQELLARRSDILDMGLEHARELHKRAEGDFPPCRRWSRRTRRDDRRGCRA